MEVNITNGFKEAEFGGVAFIHMAQETRLCWAVVNTVLNLRVLHMARNFLTS
jgi:hypothetical protein